MKFQDTISSASRGGGAPTPEKDGEASTASVRDTLSWPLPDIGHVDYNLHPLKVASLDHYIAQPAGDVRFRIS